MVDVGVIGAGAIAEQAYLPAVDRASEATLRWVVDTDAERAAEAAEAFNGDAWTTEYATILPDIDAAIVATPPRFHGEISRACLSQGIHVLTEKPVATGTQEAAELVSLAREGGLHFAISRQQREAPACRLIATFVDNGALGPIEGFTVRYGDQTNWPFASDYRLRGGLAGGGVLLDRGSHVLDVLLWIFGKDVAVEDYRDDSYGGLEANAELLLRFPGNVRGEVELTASRAIDQTFVVTGSHGEIAAHPNGEVAFLTDGDGDERIELRITDGLDDFLARVIEQTDRFLEAAATGSGPYVPAATDLPLIRLFETCYAGRGRIELPWERPPRAPSVRVQQ